MILIDDRTGSKELLTYIMAIGVPCEISRLEFGDFAFEGNGPRGRIAIGIERKTLHDMLNCIDDSRYAAHQRPGMNSTYDKNFLILEGNWGPGAPPNMAGVLLEKGYPCRYRTGKVMYSKLYRYMLSISLSGVTVLHSRDMRETAVNITEVYHYFQKNWEAHTALISTQILAIPALTQKPSLVRRWAADLANIGVKHSIEAERMFKTPIKLAQSTESDWMSIPGIGVKTAMGVIREIWGNKA